MKQTSRFGFAHSGVALLMGLLSLGVMSGVSWAQNTIELPQQPYLPLSMAMEAATAALAQCEAEGHRVSVAVVDRGGVLKLLLRGDGSGPHTVSSSWHKAYTSASLGRSTQELAKTIASNAETAGLREMDPQILILAGGLPIVINETVVGGIGVGGAPGGQLDEACAQAGIDAMLATAGMTASTPDTTTGIITDTTPTQESTTGAVSPEESAMGEVLLCLFAGTGATLTSDDQRLNFTCETDGENEVGLFGDVATTEGGWTLERVDFTLQAGEIQVQSSEPVQIVGVELEDGAFCQLAGMNADNRGTAVVDTSGAEDVMVVEGQPLQYLCDQSGDSTTGLLGEIQASEDGWLIEKAMISGEGKEATIESSEMVLISGLEVISIASE